ncbi:MAG: shikimate kinase [Spirochaetota bacterium]|jgi:shikimate dehydrogenase|nr:shikimate kinase [Spirochaetota bacterium]
MKKSFGLLGEKLGHSFSPLIHSFLGDYDYALYEIAPDDLASFMAAKRFDGINVTIPYKQAVLPYCATLSDEARMIGSVNTIIQDAHGELHGHNTDAHGFRVMLARARIDPCGKKALVLGDGGSALAVRAALTGQGASAIITISRRGGNHYGNIARHHDAAIIINTTPVGMYPHTDASPIGLAGFSGLEGIADLIYNPMRTRLLLEAEQLGIPRTGGLAMLVAQAEMASRLFTHGAARPELVDTIHDAILKRTRNIALIGMPGCGKSMTGAMLAEETGRPFVDIDQRITALAGKSIPAIFDEDGEEAFRQLETRALREEAKKSGMVIATGGGVVTRPENLDLLRQNSLIVYLECETGSLSTDGRPLSRRVGIPALAKQRLPLYRAWSDYTIPVGLNEEHAIRKILEVII